MDCTPNMTFRLSNYSEILLKEKISSNLDCLKKTLEYNVKNRLFFFRIGSGLIPFASHEVCKFNWREEFKEKFKKIGSFIKKNHIRISMHPDQFVLINSSKKEIVKRSFAELEYHCDVLDLMELDESAKVQIHVGGVYGDKASAIKRFIENYKILSENVKKRLCIENEERMYSLKDCLEIHEKIGIPIIFDFFHHSLNNHGEKIFEGLKLVKETWKKRDGIPIADYSSQKKEGRFGAHTESIDLEDFKKTLNEIKISGVDIDIMLEIKDKEKSGLRALELLENILNSV